MDDLEIARAAQLLPISQVADTLGLDPSTIEPYGRNVAKIDLDEAAESGTPATRAKYVVVSAITPTPLGEGKTTTVVGLVDGLRRIGHNAVATLRQPSMGPTFGIKGGAAGGGHAQVVPMEKLNLQLTGDFHAVTAANNLLAAMVDNHLHQGNALDIAPHSITWRRVLDVNDRALRKVVIGLGSAIDGVPRETSFDITAASEVMAILALSQSRADLRKRLGRIVIGANHDGDPVTADDLGATGAMAVILADGIKPNLLQTLEGTPTLVHCGPFGNISIGTSSVLADKLALRHADYVITEAGFGADMGAERCFDVKCRTSGLVPDAVVLVVTVRAMKLHSGRFKIKPGHPVPTEMLRESPDDVLAGRANLEKHLDIVRRFGITPVVAINAFPDDHPSEHDAIAQIAAPSGAAVVVTKHVAEGGAGAEALAKAVVAGCAEPSNFTLLYPDSASPHDKIETIAKQIYGADGITLSGPAKRALERYDAWGFGHLPVVIAKTHLSISSDPNLKGAPTGWTMPVDDVRLAAGAGYLYAVCGSMRTMPGLGRRPNAVHIDIDEHGVISGLS